MRFKVQAFLSKNNFVKSIFARSQFETQCVKLNDLICNKIFQYLQTLTDFSGHNNVSTNGGSKESDAMAGANTSFFSLTEEDDPIGVSPQHSPTKNSDLGRGTSPGSEKNG